MKARKKSSNPLLVIFWYFIISFIPHGLLATQVAQVTCAEHAPEDEVDPRVFQLNSLVGEFNFE